MTASILNGKLVASQLQQTLIEQTNALLTAGFSAPGLAVILANDSPPSAAYVNNKRRACQRIGIKTFDYDLSPKTTEAELLALIETLNLDPAIHGILVQLPLPHSIQTQTVLETVRPNKDVDGFHPYNLGRLAQRHPTLRSCTPFGIMQLMDAYQIPIKGKHAVVIGASNIVGRPMALELLMSGATITVCHRLTADLSLHVKNADILIIATGSRGCINIDWLQPHQVVIDVGMHRLEDGTFCGDLDFEAAKEKVAWITPVPGGVGPMTVTALLQNTLSATLNHYGLSKSSQ